MADSREPPPFFDEDPTLKDDEENEDLFASTTQVFKPTFFFVT